MSSQLSNTTKLLLRGEITSWEFTPWGSNYTFLVEIQRDGVPPLKAVYKPRKGEAPLWDFPSGTLYKREYAAYLLSQLLGWDFVPPTVLRDGPHGIGSLQLYIEHDPRRSYFYLRERHREALQLIACFDLVANNADRKSSHCFEGADGRVWGIDHGLTFHPSSKLRTVIWDFCGEPVPQRLLQDLHRLCQRLRSPSGLAHVFTDLLAPEELEALVARIEGVLAHPEYPPLDPYFNIPRPPF